MKFLTITAAVLSLGVLAAAGHLGHGNHGHDAVSYSVVTKHEDPKGHDHGHHVHDVGHEHYHHHELDHGHDHQGHHESYVSHGHQEEHHGHHGHDDHHDDHHGHYEHHDHAEHGEHKVEHHGNNGDDDHHGHHEHEGHHEHHHDEYSHPKYEFKYGVKDPKTGDAKEQWESRDGDSVKGAYTLKDADGTTRVVKYTADKKKGFEATVHKIGHAHAEHHDQHEHHGHH